MKPTTLASTSKLLRDKKISSRELTEQILKHAKQVQAKTNAFITIDEENALNMADAADKRRAKQDNQSQLLGVPFSMKDVYNTKNIQTTAASNVLYGYKSQYNSTVYQKLVDQGGVLIGKNNQDAWGHGGSSENTDFGVVKNPWDTSRVAGGSSGGTAAAIAGGASVYGIAEDTGGSIRNPASFCNLTGLKVTYGRVSRYGAIAYASSFDTVGPIAKTAQDCAIIMEQIAGYDPKDASSSHDPVPKYSRALNQPLKGKTIGIVKEFFNEGLNQDVSTSIDTAIKTLTDQGMLVKEISLPTVKYGHAIYYVLAFAETSSNLARYDGVRYGHDRQQFTDETLRRIMTGTFGLSSGYYDAYYKKATQARTVLINEFSQAFNEVDVIAGPVMPFPAYPIGDIASQFSGDNYALAMYLADIYTCLANTVGIPAISLPVGFSKDGLPIGMQLHANMFQEALLLNVAHQYQTVTNWHNQEAKL